MNAPFIQEIPISRGIAFDNVDLVKKCIEYATDKKYQQLQPHTYTLHSRNRSGNTAIQVAIGRKKYHLVCECI